MRKERWKAVQETKQNGFIILERFGATTTTSEEDEESFPAKLTEEMMSVICSNIAMFHSASRFVAFLY
jgi:hypothetical protein